MKQKFKEYFIQVEESRKGQKMKHFVDELDLYNDKNNIVIDYLNYWILYKSGFDKNEIDKLWLNDENSKIYRRSNEVYADTIFSAWGPFKHIIFLITGEKYNKNINDLYFIKENINKIFENNNEIFELLNKFMELACTEGNVIEYPKQNYSGSINFNIYRGTHYSDMFLKTLGEIFDGELKSCFGNSSNYKDAKEWIEKQKLHVLFENEEISKDKIKIIKNENQEIIQDTNTIKWDNITNLNDMKSILEFYIKIIENRNKELSMLTKDFDI